VPKAASQSSIASAVYSSAVCVKANSTLSGVVKAVNQNLVVCVQSSAVYVKWFHAIVNWLKAASQNYVVFVAYVEFCYNCRMKTFFSFFHLSTSRKFFLFITPVEKSHNKFKT